MNRCTHRILVELKCMKRAATFPTTAIHSLRRLFGHSAGQLVDHWVRCLDPQEEEPAASDRR